MEHQPSIAYKSDVAVVSRKTNASKKQLAKNKKKQCILIDTKGVL